jgi:large subunit ribosomal protein L9
MKILLLQDVKKIGKKGEIVNVSDGLARNSLFPRKVAKEATESVLKQYEKIQGDKASSQAAKDDKLHEFLSEVKGKTFKTTRKANANGGLFGKIDEKEIVKILSEQGVDLNVKMINIPGYIKESGEHTIKVSAAGRNTEFTLEILGE